MYYVEITYILCSFVCFDESTTASSMPHCAIAVTDIAHVYQHSGDGCPTGGRGV